MNYDDGRIICDDDGLEIRWYYLWGHKRIPYDALKAVTRRELTGARGRWRIWGSSDLRHWYNLDRTRPQKQWALDLTTGRWFVPVITPDHPDEVESLLRGHLASPGTGGTM